MSRRPDIWFELLYERHNKSFEKLAEAERKETKSPMTFTSIPPSLRPVVEDVARRRWGDLLWENRMPDIETAILAFLNACVERGVGSKVRDTTVFVHVPSLIINLEEVDNEGG